MKKRNRKLTVTYRDIANEKGVTPYAVRRAVSRGILDPQNIDSICKYIHIVKRGRKCTVGVEK